MDYGINALTLRSMFQIEMVEGDQYVIRNGDNNILKIHTYDGEGMLNAQLKHWYVVKFTDRKIVNGMPKPQIRTTRHVNPYITLCNKNAISNAVEYYFGMDVSLFTTWKPDMKSFALLLQSGDNLRIASSILPSSCKPFYLNMQQGLALLTWSKLEGQKLEEHTHKVPDMNTQTTPPVEYVQSNTIRHDHSHAYAWLNKNTENARIVWVVGQTREKSKFYTVNTSYDTAEPKYLDHVDGNLLTPLSHEEKQVMNKCAEYKTKVRGDTEAITPSMILKLLSFMGVEPADLFKRTEHKDTNNV